MKIYFVIFDLTITLVVANQLLQVVSEPGFISGIKSSGLRVLWLTRIDQEVVFVVRFFWKEQEGYILFKLPGSRQQKFLVLRFLDIKEQQDIDRVKRMASMNTRLNIIQKHGGSNQVGFKQLGPGVETGVQSIQSIVSLPIRVEPKAAIVMNYYNVCLLLGKRAYRCRKEASTQQTMNLWVPCLVRRPVPSSKQGAQGGREAEVFQVSNDDIAVAQRRLEDKQPEEKTNTDCLVKEQEKNIRLDGRSRRQWMLGPVKVNCIFLGYHKSIVGNKLWRLDDVTSKVVLYKNMCFNESGKYKKTFISSGVASSQEVQTQDLIYYHLARDKEQHLACELFGYRKDINEAAFAVVVGEKIYVHEPPTFNNTVACEVISKWKARMKDDMDAWLDVYVLSNDDMVFLMDARLGSRLPRVFLDKAKGNILGMEVIKNQSGYTMRVSQSSLSGECDVEKNGKWSCIYAVGSQEYQMVCTIPNIASTDVGMLDGFDRGLQTYVHVFVNFDYAMGRSITRYGFMILGCAGSLKANLQHMEALSTTKAGYMTFTEAWKKKIWLKGLLTESRCELKLVAGIATGALVKGGSRSEVPAQVEVAAYRMYVKREFGFNVYVKGACWFQPLPVYVSRDSTIQTPYSYSIKEVIKIINMEDDLNLLSQMIHGQDFNDTQHHYQNLDLQMVIRLKDTMLTGFLRIIFVVTDEVAVRGTTDVRIPVDSYKAPGALNIPGTYMMLR
nr:zinc finger, CCHC-type [Tanacetum cinerariifolium]